MGANGGRDQGTAILSSDNGTDRSRATSTGGGSPGARVGGHHGQEDMQQVKGLPRIHQLIQTVIGEESHLGQQINTEGEQQQQSTAGLEIQHKMQGEIQDQDWGESRWEEIVLHPRVGQEQMSKSMGCRCTHLEQHSRDKQRAGRWRNKPQTAGMRANIKSFCQGAANICAKLIPTEEQIRAAIRKEVIAVESRAAEGDGFRAMAEEIHASRTREEEMVQELILQ
jgi:hypothetical protein